MYTPLENNYVDDFNVKTFEESTRDIQFNESGSITTVADGVITIVGLDNLEIGEIVLVGISEIEALVLNLEPDYCKAVLLSDDFWVEEGDDVFRTQSGFECGVGVNLLGRVVDCFGTPIDEIDEDIQYEDFVSVDTKAHDIMSRQSVCEPMPTGIKIIDILFPIGNGQRQLIIGDRQTGKTSVAIDAIINQKNNELPMVCIYVAIGQREASVAYLVSKLKEHEAMHYTVVMLAGAADTAALQYLIPYVGCAVGEWFMNNGGNALIVYDDLSKHAVAYRQLSLLLKRPSGRDAYPGDIFYLHSRLLERAAKLNENYGSGSLTALPIVETLAGDLSAYIPTNVISITDGQIVTSGYEFRLGNRPAVNVRLSVSRVGSAAQNKLMKFLATPLKQELSMYNEVKIYTSFSEDLDPVIERIITRGSRIVELLKQRNFEPMDWEDQFIVVFSGVFGHVDTLPLEKMQDWETFLLNKHKECDFFDIESESADMIVSQLNDSMEDLVELFLETI
jgi:F-type H+-transporting ATPase subunit alpha